MKTPNARGAVLPLHPGRVAAFGCPDPRRALCPNAPLGVGEALAELERAQPRMEQRLERMGQRSAEELDGVGVDEPAQHRRAAVRPALLKVGLAPVWRRAGVRGRRGRGGCAGRACSSCLVGAQLPVAQPVVHPGQAVRVVELGRKHRGDAEAEQPGAGPPRRACAARGPRAGRWPPRTGRAIPRRRATGRGLPTTAGVSAGPGRTCPVPARLQSAGLTLTPRWLPCDGDQVQAGVDVKRAR